MSTLVCRAETKFVFRRSAIPKKESEHSAPPFEALGNAADSFLKIQNIMVVDKLAGMASHGGSGISYGLIERIESEPPGTSVPGTRPSLGQRDFRRIGAG